MCRAKGTTLLRVYFQSKLQFANDGDLQFRAIRLAAHETRLLIANLFDYLDTPMHNIYSDQ